MRAHFLQHVQFEGLGSIETWLRRHRYEITCTRFYDFDRKQYSNEQSDSGTFRDEKDQYRLDVLPDPNDIDFLVVMGGPMSVNDEGEFPWLVSEKELVRRVIRVSKPVLGVCLGAQLISSAMGARVYRNPEKEIGWFPVRGVSSDGPDSFRFPSSLMVFHWHGETFDLPAGAVRLAESDACDNQAFQLGRKVLGLQFHLETTPDSAREIVINCREELRPSRFVQSDNEILAAPISNYAGIHDVMEQVLSWLTGI